MREGDYHFGRGINVYYIVCTPENKKIIKSYKKVKMTKTNQSKSSRLHAKDYI